MDDQRPGTPPGPGPAPNALTGAARPNTLAAAGPPAPPLPPAPPDPATGWVLPPSTEQSSLRPNRRYRGLAGPAFVVSGVLALFALVGLAAADTTPDRLEALGWLIVFGGIAVLSARRIWLGSRPPGESASLGAARVLVLALPALAVLPLAVVSMVRDGIEPGTSAIVLAAIGLAAMAGILVAAIRATRERS